jgi:type I restriction enzyme S subunit
LKGEERYVTVVDVCVIRLSDSSVEPKYLAHLVNSPQIRGEIAKYQSGSTRKRISRGNLSKIRLPIAPLPEQRRIVAKIDELFSELDKGVESLTIAREQLKAYRQSALKHAFEGKLTEDWRKKNVNTGIGETLRQRVLGLRRQEWEKAERARLQIEGRLPARDDWKRRYPEPEVFDRQELPDLPSQWCWVGLDEIVSGKPRSMQSGPFGSNLRHSEFRKSGVLVLGIDNVREGYFSIGSENHISEEKFRELEKYQARPGDLLITVMASLGRTCIVPRDLEKAIITKHVYRVSMEEELLYPEYFNLLLQSQTVSRIRMFKNAQGQTRPGLNSSILKALPLPLCCRDEQVEIASRLSSQVSNIDVATSQIDVELARAAALKRSILKHAFTGKLVAQEPADEPVWVLLDRIKGERERAAPKRVRGKSEAA